MHWTFLATVIGILLGLIADSFLGVSSFLAAKKAA